MPRRPSSGLQALNALGAPSRRGRFLFVVDVDMSYKTYIVSYESYERFTKERLAMSIRENINTLKESMYCVEAHHMYASLQDNGAGFVVTYPAGDFPVDGLFSSYRDCSKSEALKKLIPFMDKHWKESYP